MTGSVVIGSTSLAQDAAYLAMADAVAAANRIGVEYRIIGGQMVSVHVAASGADAPPRMTGDTDLGLEATLLADNRLLEGLRAVGYALVAGNRLERDDGTRAIDDDVLGLRYALSRDPLLVDLQVRLTTGTLVELRPAVPDLAAAICLKALAFQARAAPRDAVDVWRLLRGRASHRPRRSALADHRDAERSSRHPPSPVRTRERRWRDRCHGHTCAADSPSTARDSTHHVVLVHQRRASNSFIRFRFGLCFARSAAV
jgi:hypothetical protein